MTEDETVLVLAEDPASPEFQMVAVEEHTEILDHSVLFKYGPQVCQVDAGYAGLCQEFVGDALGMVCRVSVRDLYREVLKQTRNIIPPK